MSLFVEDGPEDYLELVKDWEDPWPDPVIEVYDGISVVRDDLLGSGSKVRFVDYYIQTLPESVKEVVFGNCPATGYAQISLPIVCRKYGRKAVLFMAERKLDKLHPYQTRGMEEGAIYNWVKMGMLSVTKAHAKKYVEERPNERVVLPLGLEHPTVLGSIIKVARKAITTTPSEIWSVGSSGTINRGLQMAFPDFPVHVVQTGHSMNEREIGRAKHWVSPYKFDKPIKEKEAPPFPSAPTYDAKAWPFIKEHAKPQSLFWNVGA